MGDASEQAAITVPHVPWHQVDSLRDLVKQHGLDMITRGWMVRRFVILGTPAAIAAFQPALAEWQAEWAMRDAW